MEYSTLFDLTGKVAMVTGAGRGIGRALAEGLAYFGCNLVAIDKDLENQQDVINAIEKMDKECLFLHADLSDCHAISRVVDEAASHFGKIDILVNNAGLNIRRPALDYTEEEWDLIVDTDLKGVFFVTQSVGKIMVRRGEGKIINIASAMGLVGSPSYQTVVPYCASKGGVVQLTKAFALEWAKYNIYVNAIAPGYVKTAIVQPILDDKEKYDMVLNFIPLKRFSDPEELVGPAVFLASAASNYMTGHILCADGGWLAQ